MRGLAFVVLGALAMLLIGCSGGRCGGSGGATAGQERATPTPPAAPAPATAPPTGLPAATAAAAAGVNLPAALLTASDVPNGWDETTLNVDLATTQPCGRPIPLIDAASQEDEVAYRQDRLGPYVVHRVMSYPGDSAEQAMNATQTLLDECKEWKGRHGGRELTFSVAPSSLPVDGLGDQAFAVELTIEGLAGGGLVGGLLDNVLSAVADLVLVRRGDATFLLAQATGGLGSPNVDHGRTEQLAQLADQRLAGATGR
jgi:hypothetical protein